MNIAVENVTDLTRKMTITLSGQKVGKALDKAYNKLKKDAKLKGFRRGKIPRSVLEKNFGEQVQDKVGIKLVQETYFDAVEKEGLDPIVHPEIAEPSFGDDGTFTYVAVVDVKPEFDLQGYKGLEIEKPVIEVSDAEVDEELEQLRRQHAALRSADEGHAIGNDDMAIVDFQGFHKGKAMKEVHNEDYSIDVGSRRLGEEFEQKLIGMKKDEKTLYEVDFPGDHVNPIMAGKTIEFKVDVKDIKVRIKPDLDDEFAKDINQDHQTLDDLKKEVHDRLKSSKEAALKGDLNDRIMHKLIELNTFDAPQRLVKYEIQEVINKTEETLKQSGLTLESAGIKLEDLIEENREGAVKRVRGDLLLKKVAEVEEIKLTDEDIERGYQRIAVQYKMSLPEVKSYFKRREELIPFMNELLNEKILRFLRDEAKITEVAAEEKDEV